MIQSGNFVYFEIRTSYSTEHYICEVNKHSSRSIELQCSDFLDKHCFCDEYEIVGYRLLTEEELKAVQLACMDKKYYDAECDCFDTWSAQWEVKEKFPY